MENKENKKYEFKINTDLLKKNLEENNANEFIEYYVKLNKDLDEKKENLENDKKQFNINVAKEIEKINLQKEKLQKDFESKKKQLNEYEKYLDDYKNRLSQAQKKFYLQKKMNYSSIFFTDPSNFVIIPLKVE